MKTFSRGGVHPHENKLSARVPFQEVALPDVAIFPLDQHIGAPAKPVVAVGDPVKVGQLIAEAGGFVSANIHTSVSGKVTKIADYVDTWGYRKPAIYIQREGDEWLDTIIRDKEVHVDCDLAPAEIIDKIKAGGIVGLGGACFPTHVKLMPPPNAKIDTLIVNAVECEPFLTHNHELMLTEPKQIIVGTHLVLKALQITKAYIGIEENKMDAVAKLQEAVKDLSFSDCSIEIVPLKTKYPQGGEKQLIEALTGRKVPSGAIPAMVGCVVDNVATIYSIYEAVQLNKPLIEVTMTVTGLSVEKPGNFIVRTGTPIPALFDLVGGIPDTTAKIVGGGPMMGKSYSNLDSPITKRSSGLLMIDAKDTPEKVELDCIRCGKCVVSCPMCLEPYLLATQVQLKLWDEAEEHQIMDCIECGCCTFSCPSQRKLIEYLRYGKTVVGARIRARKNK